MEFLTTFDTGPKILDHITTAIHAENYDVRFSTTRYDIAANYFRTHKKELFPAFDWWLVKTKDPLSNQPGTPQHRFAQKVWDMAKLAGKPEHVPAFSRRHI